MKVLFDETDGSKLILTEMYDALAVMMLGIKPDKIEFIQAEGKYHFVFTKSTDLANTITLWEKNLEFLQEETKQVKKRFYQDKATAESKDPFTGIGKTFKDNNRRIRGAARKGSDGKWHG